MSESVSYSHSRFNSGRFQEHILLHLNFCLVLGTSCFLHLHVITAPLSCTPFLFWLDPPSCYRFPCMMTTLKWSRWGSISQSESITGTPTFSARWPAAVRFCIFLLMVCWGIRQCACSPQLGVIPGFHCPWAHYSSRLINLDRGACPKIKCFSTK